MIGMRSEADDRQLTDFQFHAMMAPNFRQERRDDRPGQVFQSSRWTSTQRSAGEGCIGAPRLRQQQHRSLYHYHYARAAARGSARWRPGLKEPTDNRHRG
jgi:hypothetical protein